MRNRSIFSKKVIRNKWHICRNALIKKLKKIGKWGGSLWKKQMGFLRRNAAVLKNFILRKFKGWNKCFNGSKRSKRRFTNWKSILLSPRWGDIQSSKTGVATRKNRTLTISFLNFSLQTRNEDYKSRLNLSIRGNSKYKQESQSWTSRSEKKKIVLELKKEGWHRCNRKSRRGHLRTKKVSCWKRKS